MSRAYQVSESGLVPSLNGILADIQDRLDQLQGLRGVTTTESNVVTTGAMYASVMFPSQAIVPIGGGSDPGRDTTTGYLEFDGSSTESIAGACLMPRSWKEGSVVSPVVHWGKTTSATGTVQWEWRYRYHDMGRTITSWSDWFPATAEVPDGDTADRHARADMPNITLSAITGALLHWQLRRVGGSDTYAADAQLYAFALNIQIDRLGSSTEFAA